MFQLLACQTKMANSHIFNSLLQRDFVVSLSDVSIVDLSKNMANTHFFQPLQKRLQFLGRCQVHLWLFIISNVGLSIFLVSVVGLSKNMANIHFFYLFSTPFSRWLFIVSNVGLSNFLMFQLLTCLRIWQIHIFSNLRRKDCNSLGDVKFINTLHSFKCKLLRDICSVSFCWSILYHR